MLVLKWKEVGTTNLEMAHALCCDFTLHLPNDKIKHAGE